MKPRDVAIATRERATMQRLNKAAKIRELYAQGLKLREIAAEVGCRVEYVRTCARQRLGGGMSEIDKRYRAKPHVRERLLANSRERYVRMKERAAAAGAKSGEALS